jgi:DNA-directed RNA polymerase specialized sigma24 family protein
MATSDDLIAGAAGDEEAFRQIVERHERVVRGFIFGMVADLDVVDELAQQTFVEAYRRRSTANARCGS